MLIHILVSHMKTIVITGINKGIGKALAKKFLDEGYFVIGTYRAEKPDFENKNLRACELDLASDPSIASCANKITGLGKKIDILINNAGVLLDEEETRVVTEKLCKTLEVNLIGTIDFTEKLIPLMNQDGHIVNISSTAGSLEKAGKAESHYPYHYPSYKISKAALNMYTRTLSLRLKESGITVSSVHPGWVRTDMGGQEAPASPEEAAEGIYKIAISRPETGQFWFKEEKLPW